MNKCLNEKCGFLAHSGKSFDAYCCAKCRGAHSRGTSEHGMRCERVKASMDASVAPSSLVLHTGRDFPPVICFDYRMEARSIFCIKCEDKSAYPFSSAKQFASEFFKASDVNRKELHMVDLSGWEQHLYDALISKFPGEGLLLITVKECQTISVGIATNKEARERAAKLALALAALKKQACSRVKPSLELEKVLGIVHWEIINPSDLADVRQQDARCKASSLEEVGASSSLTMVKGNGAELARAHLPAVSPLRDSCEQGRPRSERVLARSRSKRKRTLPTSPGGLATHDDIVEILSGDEDDDAKCSLELDEKIMPIIRILEEGRGQVASLERYVEDVSSLEVTPSVASIMRQQQHYEAAVLQMLASHLKSGEATKATQPSFSSASVSEPSIAEAIAIASSKAMPQPSPAQPSEAVISTQPSLREALAAASSKALPKPLPRQKAQPSETVTAKAMPRKRAQCGQSGTESISAVRDVLPLDQHEEIVDVDAILQTHDAVSSRFSDGRSFDALIQSLSSGHIDPLEAGFLRLQVFKWPGKGYYSINNRRLLCLKKHQEFMRHTDPDYVVKVRVHVRPLPEDFIQLMSRDSKFEKIVRAYSTRTEGKSVAIRCYKGSSGQPRTRK